MKSVSHVTTVNLDREVFAGLNLAQVTEIVGKSGAKVVKGSGKDRTDVDLSQYTGKVSELTLLITSTIKVPENIDDAITLLREAPETYLGHIVTGIKLDANQKMQAMVKVESPAQRAARELETRRHNAFSAWAKGREVEAFNTMQELTKNGDWTPFNKFRDELIAAAK